MPTFWARMIGRFFDAVMAKPVASFRRGLERPFEAQETALRQILSANRDTEFGRSHRFDQVLAASDIWQAYRSAVPIRNYDGFGESIEKMKNAEPDVLITGVADMFSLTSGTTSSPKFCPVNRTFVLEHHRQHLLWMYHVYKDHPICNSGKYLVVASPAEMGRTSGNIPYGAMSGKQLDIQSIPVRRRMAAPALVQHIADPEERWFNFILFALAEPELRVVTAVNPSSLVVIAQRLEKDAEKYIDCIKNGLPPDGISGSRDPAAMKLATMFKPNPPRAAALAERWRAHGILTPAMAWPGLEMLLTWQGGSSAFYLPHVESLWGGTSRRCLGLRASEGTFSIPLEDGTASAALAVGGHAMEFIPAEIDKPTENEPTLLAGELEEGRLYRLIIS
ncbi:MAG: GH3 auxin-responsive promoter family protein, partial [Planctomycetes bacterium]|nr:GH3 auxin-responsive promoter family protein [Planctomycetota bacterium]